MGEAINLVKCKKIISMILCLAIFLPTIMMNPIAAYAEEKAFEYNQDNLPEPILDGHEDWIELYNKVWEIGAKQIRYGTEENGFVAEYVDSSPGFGAGATTQVATEFYQWDSAFITQYGKYSNGSFPSLVALENLYRKQDSDGFISKSYHVEDGTSAYDKNNVQSRNPPILSWAEWENYLISGDKDRFTKEITANGTDDSTKTIFQRLIDNYYWLKDNNRYENGFYWNSTRGSGMTGTPRLGCAGNSDTGNGSWVDLAGQMALNAKCLKNIAEVIGDSINVARFQKEYDDIAYLLNNFFWDDEDGFYYDLNQNGDYYKLKTPASFWPVLAGVAITEQVQRMSKYLLDPNVFNRLNMVPSVDASSSVYESSFKWRGDTWPPMVYMVVESLNNYGLTDEAKLISENHIEALSELYATDETLYERMNADAIKPSDDNNTGSGAKPDFIGWTGLGPVTMLIEDAIGIVPNGVENTITWNLSQVTRNGIKNLDFGDNNVTLIAAARDNKANKAVINITALKPFKLDVIIDGETHTINVVAGENSYIVGNNEFPAETNTRNLYSVAAKKIVYTLNQTEIGGGFYAFQDDNGNYYTVGNNNEITASNESLNRAGKFQICPLNGEGKLVVLRSMENGKYVIYDEDSGTLIASGESTEEANAQFRYGSNNFTDTYVVTTENDPSVLTQENVMLGDLSIDNVFAKYVSNMPKNIDYTTLGTTDWIHLGGGNGTPIKTATSKSDMDNYNYHTVRKSGVSENLAFEPVGEFSRIKNIKTADVKTNWTDGTDPNYDSNVPTGVNWKMTVNEENTPGDPAGYQIEGTIPAGETLSVIIGEYKIKSNIQVFIQNDDDGEYLEELILSEDLSTSSELYNCVTVANDNNVPIKVKVVHLETEPNDSGGNIILIGALIGKDITGTMPDVVDNDNLARLKDFVSMVINPLRYVESTRHQLSNAIAVAESTLELDYNENQGEYRKAFRQLQTVYEELSISENVIPVDRVELRRKVDDAREHLLQSTESGEFSAEQLLKFSAIIDVADYDVCRNRYSTIDELTKATADLVAADLIAPNRKAIRYLTFNVGVDETQRSVIWHSESAEQGFVQIAEKPEDYNRNHSFPVQSAQNYQSTTFEVGEPGFTGNKLTISDLKPNTEYLYRVGNEETWTETYEFKTGDFIDNEFSFLVAGDAQIGGVSSEGKYPKRDGNTWNSALNLATKRFPGISFINTTGDQVQGGTQQEINEQYFELLRADALRSYPLATSVGNIHDDSIQYTEHFLMPNMSELGAIESAGAGSGDYWFEQNGVLFMNLNTVNAMTNVDENVDEHKQFMEEAISKCPDAKWKVVTFHHSIYSVGNHSTKEIIAELRNKLSPIFSSLGIDLVLMGHDHGYTRTYMMDGTNPIVPEGHNTNEGEPAASSVQMPDESQVLYITASSSTGSKYYPEVEAERDYVAVKNTEERPTIGKVDISDDYLQISFYYTDTEDMELMDTFTINRMDVDTVEPVISLPEEKMHLSLNDSFDPLKGVSAIDNFDGDLTAKIQVTGTVDTTKAGSYQLTYSVTDQANNTATVIRIVMVDNKGMLSNLITEAQAILDNADSYEPDSIAGLDEILANAKNILADENSLDTEIDDMIENLEEAINKAKLKDTKEVDKILLGELIEDAKEILDRIADYIPSTVVGLVDIYHEAKAVYDNPSASQEEVDAMADKITEELNKAVSKPNKDKLAELITLAQGLSEADYTEDSWAFFTTYLTKAQNVLEDDEATQAQVDSSYNLLSIAQGMLKPLINPNVDKTLLQLVVILAEKAIDDGEVDNAIDSVKTDFYKVFEEATAVLENENATQEEVDKAYEAMSEMLNRLGFIRGDKAALEALLELVSKIDLKDLEAGDAKEAFKAAMEDAEAVLKDGDAMQDEVDQAYDTLFKAFKALKWLDRSRLESEIAESEKTKENLDQYVEKGKPAFLEALETAKAVFKKEEVTQAEIDEALRALATARANLRYKANKDILEDLLAKAKSLDLSLYTEESVVRLRAAMDGAQKLVDDETLSVVDQENVDNAARILSDAIDLLQLKSTEGNNSSNVNNSTDNNSSGGKDSTNTAKTGDSTIVVFDAIAMLALAVTVTNRKRRNAKQMK